MNDNTLSRRTFLGATASAAAAFTVIPNYAMGSVLGHKAPSDKLNVAVIGPGGRANGMLDSAAAAGENIVALCNVDWAHARQKFEQYPNAKRYWDFRKMNDEMTREIDAVVVGTADHTHCICAAHAMTLGKHVYVEKPLTHSVYESRLLTKLAAQYKVATQMGNQGASNAGVRQICDWVFDGQIGEVTKVECATNRPIWPQGLDIPKEVMPVPETLNWDLFVGPARLIPYNSVYHPWGWRGWWEFGTGALGDMACHIMHPVFKALKLGYPTKVQASSTALKVACAPVAQRVKMTFPARPQHNTAKLQFPEVEVHWTDGGILPLYPDNWPTEIIPSNNPRRPAGPRRWEDDGAVIFHGTKDSLICGCYGANPWLLSGRTPESPKTQREVPRGPQGVRAEIHTLDWLRACKESPANRVETTSAFDEAGPFNEMVVMGVLAVRLQTLGKVLHWDGPNMQFTNIGENEQVMSIVEDSFSVIDGHPEINPRTENVNARAFAQELVKHTYRQGWTLPNMPA